MSTKVVTRESWQNEPMPAKRQRLALDNVYSPEDYEVLVRGVLPQQMEDKWFIFMEADRLYFCRSWSGFCVYEVQLTERDGRYLITEAWVNRDPEQYQETDDRHDAGVLCVLIDYLMLGREARLPQRQDLTQEENSIYWWSQIGRGRER